MIHCIGEQKFWSLLKKLSNSWQIPLCHSAQLENVATFFGVAQDQGLYRQCVVEHMRSWAPSHYGGMIPWRLWMWVWSTNQIVTMCCWMCLVDGKSFQAIRTIQILWLMYKGKGNLHCKIKKGYINDFGAQRFLSELHKDKTLINIKLVDRLLKYN